MYFLITHFCGAHAPGTFLCCDRSVEKVHSDIGRYLGSTRNGVTRPRATLNLCVTSDEAVQSRGEGDILVSVRSTGQVFPTEPVKREIRK